MDNVHSLAAHTLSWLFNYLVHSSILLGCAGLAQYCGALQQRRLAELVWRLALFGGLATASLQLGIQEYWQSPNNNSLTNAPSQIIAPNRSNLAGDSEKLLMKVERVDLTASASPVHNPTVAQLATNTPSDKATIRLPANLQDLISAMVLIWLSYCALIAAKIALNVRHLNRMAKAMPIVSRKDLTALVTKALAKRNNAQTLRVSTIFNSPFVCPNGIICLPAWALEQENQALCHAMLQHEIRHIIRKDSAWRIAQEFIKTAFFFQVLNRAADKQLTLLAEIDCDYVAVRANGVDTFAQALVRCAEMAVSSKHPSFAIPMAKSTSLLQRIDLILNEDDMNNSQSDIKKNSIIGGFITISATAIALTYPATSIAFIQPILSTPQAHSSPTSNDSTASKNNVEDIEKFNAAPLMLDSKLVKSPVAQAAPAEQQTKASVGQAQVHSAVVTTQNTNQESLLAQAHRAFDNKNYIQAFEIYNDLANTGNAEAQAFAGEMLWYGDGIASNPDAAKTLLSKAAAQGHKKAQEFLKLFAERKNRQAELDFYTNAFDGGSLKWTATTCEGAVNKTTQSKNVEIKDILDCYNNYISSIKQGLESGSYLPADINQIMRVEELEKSKQLARTVLFKQGLEAKSYVESRLSSFKQALNDINEFNRESIRRERGTFRSENDNKGLTMADGSPVPGINRAPRHW
jgi:hypothetical protein